MLLCGKLASKDKLRLKYYKRKKIILGGWGSGGGEERGEEKRWEWRLLEMLKVGVEREKKMEDKDIILYFKNI